MADADLAARSIWPLGRKSAALQSEFHFTLSSAHKVSRPSSERKDVQIFRTCEKTRSQLALPARRVAPSSRPTGVGSTPLCLRQPAHPAPEGVQTAVGGLRGGRQVRRHLVVHELLPQCISVVSRVDLCRQAVARRTTVTIHFCSRTRLCEITEYKSYMRLVD